MLKGIDTLPSSVSGAVFRPSVFILKIVNIGERHRVDVGKIIVFEYPDTVPCLCVCVRACASAHTPACTHTRKLQLSNLALIPKFVSGKSTLL